jgi:RNA polymerase sigma-70 factor (ECF subfamily)
MRADQHQAVALPVSGRDAELTLLYRREFSPLAGYCFRLVGEEQAARDVASEAFVRLCGRLSGVREPRAWLYMVATNLVRDGWARDNRQRAVLDLLRRRREVPVAAFDPSVRDAVDRLPRRLRLVVVLHYVADLPVHEVAQATGLPAGTVKRRLHEARAILAQALGATDD